VLQRPYQSSYSLHRFKNLEEESPLEGRNTLSGGANTLKNHQNLSSAGLRVQNHISRWIRPISGPDRVGISHRSRRAVATTKETLPMSDRRYRRHHTADIASAYRIGAYKGGRVVCMVMRDAISRTRKRCKLFR